MLSKAKCFEDKLDTMNVLIKSLSVNGTSINEACDHCVSSWDFASLFDIIVFFIDNFFLCMNAIQFAVLESLGESFPKDLDNDSVKQELVHTNSKLQQLLPESLENLPMMEDKQKKDAMVST